MAMNQYAQQQAYMPSAAPRRGSFVRGDSNMSSPPDCRLGMTAHPSENMVNSSVVTKKYVCSLCAGCRPTKRSNIEQHIWQRHAAHHGGDSYLHRYRATDHKNLVARFVREVAIPDSKTGADVHIPSTPPPAVRSPTPEAAANVYSIDCTASTASSPNMNISTATTMAAASDSMSTTYETVSGNTAHPVQSAPMSASDLAWDANLHGALRHGTPRNAANRGLQRARSWGVPNTAHPTSTVEPATFVRRLISQATGINTDVANDVAAVTLSPRRSMSYDRQASTGQHHHQQHHHGHKSDYHRRCSSGAADSDAVLAALAELLRRGEVEIVPRPTSGAAHQQQQACSIGHHVQGHHQSCKYADRRHESAICSPSMVTSSTTSPLTAMASGSSLPTAASTTPPPTSSAAHNHHHHQGRQQHHHQPQPRPARQQRDLLSVLLQMGSTHSSTGLASFSPSTVPAHAHHVQTMLHRAPARMVPMQTPAAMEKSPSSIWRPVDL